MLTCDGMSRVGDEGLGVEHVPAHALDDDHARVAVESPTRDPDRWVLARAVLHARTREDGALEEVRRA